MINKFTGEYRFLSNFQSANVVGDGVIYKSVEHAFQAMKSLDSKERQMIWQCETPAEAKRLGRKITLRPDWENIKDSIMLSLVLDKFKNPLWRKLLLETGDEILQEGNTWGDTYWGVCKGKGKNRLGEILMRVRDYYRELEESEDEDEDLNSQKR